MLVGIASYGQKNLSFLKRIIATYQEMEMVTEIIVFSEAPKELGPGIRVAVGLPDSNPWSLPFAHKTAFAQEADHFDLFVYTEDDIFVTEQQIRQFLLAAPEMADDEIPGYLRYELTSEGSKLLTDVHGSFHWKPETVARRGEYTIAEFSNEHAGFYILTQAQLRRAIASGGFLKAPYEGRYGLPETAATDPYTCCGFRKVICISHLDDFLVHHMSNVYVNRHGVSLPSFQEQVHTLFDIAAGHHPVSHLTVVEPKVLQRKFSKRYYEKPGADLLELLPTGAATVLSLGTGCCALETELQRRGCQVTALPLDTVVLSVANRKGIETIDGTWQECFRKLNGRTFDCVLTSNVLHLQADPGEMLKECCRCVRSNGTLVLAGPNFGRFPIVMKRVLKQGDYGKLRSFEASGVNPCGPSTLARPLRRAGLRISDVRWINHEFGREPLAQLHLSWGRLTAKEWVLKAKRVEC